MLHAIFLLVFAVTVWSPVPAAARMRTELITITAPDGTELDGAYYTTDGDTRPLAERKVSR